MCAKRALIGMSGGVDSAVAAYLTQQEGFTCIGATMQLLSGNQPDAADARAIAQRLGMEHRVLPLQEAFRQLVIEDFIRSYETGLTPNPCVVCNKKLKFGVLLEAAVQLDCNYVVTGHYARILPDTQGHFLLCKAAEDAKDQSYFLFGLTQHQLAHARFPLGDLTKAQAREIAASQGFINARKRDSQDICFVPDGDYKTFLQQATGKNYPCGDFLDLQGQPVGRHSGAVGYTLGQRKGLGLAMGQPVYVCGKDMAANTVTVGPNEALFATSLLAGDLNWIPFNALTQPLRCCAKARSRMFEQPATVYPLENGQVRVEFDQPQRALTPGQAVVFYDGELVLGGGTIRNIL